VISSTATVYTDIEMQVGDYLKEGTLPSGTSADPIDEDGFEIRKISKIPSVNGKYYVYAAMVK